MTVVDTIHLDDDNDIVDIVDKLNDVLKPYRLAFRYEEKEGETSYELHLVRLMTVFGGKGDDKLVHQNLNLIDCLLIARQMHQKFRQAAREVPRKIEELSGTVGINGDEYDLISSMMTEFDSLQEELKDAYTMNVANTIDTLIDEGYVIQRKQDG
jgi:hypothetical protein